MHSQLSRSALLAQEKDLRQAQALQKPAQPLDFNSVIQHIVLSLRKTEASITFSEPFPNDDGATSGTISAGLVIPLGHPPDRPSRDLNHDFWYAETPSTKWMTSTTAVRIASVNGDFLRR